jgi:hypothetical protein
VDSVALERGYAGRIDPFWLERAHASGDDHCLAVPLALAGGEANDSIL